MAGYLTAGALCTESPTLASSHPASVPHAGRVDLDDEQQALARDQSPRGRDDQERHCPLGIERVRGTPECYATAARFDITRNATTTSHPRYCRPGTTRCDCSHFGIPYRDSFTFAGNFELPLGLRLGTSVVSTAGAVVGGTGERILPDSSLVTTWSVPASVFPGGRRTQAVNVRLDVPGSEYLERWNQVDVSFRRVFRVGR